MRMSVRDEPFSPDLSAGVVRVFSNNLIPSSGEVVTVMTYDAFTKLIAQADVRGEFLKSLLKNPATSARMDQLPIR